MSQFFEITRYEYRLSTRRIGFWIAYLLLGLFYSVTVLLPSGDPASDIISPDQIWQEAGSMIFIFNIFMPLLAGILAADRMQRDFQSGINELQRSTPLSNSVYLMAKYLGVLASVLTPFFIIAFGNSTLMIIRGQAPLQFLWPVLLAVLAIAVPAHAFVVAFSLACPLIMPLRVYQVLFTGYWFWGNLLSPQAFPTISDTILNAVGQYPVQAYFGTNNTATHPVSDGFTQPQAVLNLIVLTTCIAAALFTVNIYLRWRAQRA